jgi:hypothetical protein
MSENYVLKPFVVLSVIMLVMTFVVIGQANPEDTLDRQALSLMQSAFMVTLIIEGVFFTLFNPNLSRLRIIILIYVLAPIATLIGFLLLNIGTGYRPDLLWYLKNLIVWCPVTINLEILFLAYLSRYSLVKSLLKKET